MRWRQERSPTCPALWNNNRPPGGRATARRTNYHMHNDDDDENVGLYEPAYYKTRCYVRIRRIIGEFARDYPLHCARTRQLSLGHIRRQLLGKFSCDAPDRSLSGLSLVFAIPTFVTAKSLYK
jgi:hypothetical protein